MRPREDGVDPEWLGIARLWGVLAGLGLVLATGLWALDAFGLLGAAPVYTATAAGQVNDEAVYYVAEFAWRRRNLWDFVLRDVLYSLAYLSFIPLMLAANVLTGRRWARVQVAGGFTAAAAVFGVLNAIPFLAASEYWRNTGWETVPPEVMLTVGRQTDALDQLSRMAGNAAYAALAVGLAYLGAACWSVEGMPRWLTPVAWIGTACLVAMLVIGELAVDTGHAWDILGLLVGVLVAPLVTIGLGLHLGGSARWREA